MKNIIVLGGSYGGARAARVLASGLQTDHRVILIDRNSHANHVYILPRLGVLPGHEHKAFIPYTRFFSPPSSPTPQDTSTDASDEPGPSTSRQSRPRHLFLHASAIKLNEHSVTLDRAFPEHGLPSTEIPFEFLVYALGSHLPAPIDLWTSDYGSDTEEEEEGSQRNEKPRYGGTKGEGIAWLKRFQDRVARSQNVLVVGGGALGVQYATDIATVYPTKHVTLLHSRNRLLPRFDPAMHTEVVKGLEDARIEVILGERLDLSSISNAKSSPDNNGRIVRTEKGREISCDLLLLCTGQLPNTGLLRELSPDSVDPLTGLAHVLPTMQLGILPSNEAEMEEEVTLYPHIFVIGDAADAFGAIKAGHTASFQAEVAAANILRLIEFDEKVNGRGDDDDDDDELKEHAQLQHYVPGPPQIKVSLGLRANAVYEVNGVVGRKNAEEPEDLYAHMMWPYFGFKDVTPEEMHL
ncbi:FAD/NAD(P)-binding domain-containing protein [Schizopora paradoxa]|uniref:FAD/NAD(P)-binding domain-containing protein n=1 Tax=Schizopora paradoxa TaxID=27342 RepID=A0A0H2SG94_9AGAM|nr:FAD/NAD(P)-binding domain-containing protein [Schizopora paradoxa]